MTSSQINKDSTEEAHDGYIAEILEILYKQ